MLLLCWYISGFLLQLKACECAENRSDGQCIQGEPAPPLPLPSGSIVVHRGRLTPIFLWRQEQKCFINASAHVLWEKLRCWQQADMLAAGALAVPGSLANDCRENANLPLWVLTLQAYTCKWKMESIVLLGVSLWTAIRQRLLLNLKTFQDLRSRPGGKSFISPFSFLISAQAWVQT